MSRLGLVRAPGATTAALAAKKDKAVYEIDLRDHGWSTAGVAGADKAALDSALVAAHEATSAPGVEIKLVPGILNLVSGGASAPITRNNLWFVGALPEATRVLGGTGTLFPWGDGVVGGYGGGIRGLNISYPSAPDSAAKVVDVDKANRLSFSDLTLDNVRCLASLGVSGARGAGVVIFEHIYGTTDPAAGSVVIDARFGTGLFLDTIQLGAKGVGFPHAEHNVSTATGDATLVADAGSFTSLDLGVVSGTGIPPGTTLLSINGDGSEAEMSASATATGTVTVVLNAVHPANDTTFLRFGQGSWDTAFIRAVITNRYNRGLDLNLESAVSVSNMWITDCAWDYCKTSGVRLRTNHAGASLRSIYLNLGWAVATDGHSVLVDGALGAMKNVLFLGGVGRQAGQNNWRFQGGVMERVNVVACHSLGANRLAATNTGNLQDDVVILGSGVTLRGNSFNEDGQSYTGFANQGRFGVNIAPDLAKVVVVDNEVAVGTGGLDILVNANTVSSVGRRVHGNRSAGGARPSYATTSAPAAPASGVVQTHLAPTIDKLYIYGGTITQITHNAAEVATSGPLQLLLEPGDTWSVTGSGYTVKRIVSP